MWKNTTFQVVMIWLLALISIPVWTLFIAPSELRVPVALASATFVTIIVLVSWRLRSTK